MRCGDRRVALMTGRTDRVVAAPLRPQPTRGVVDDTALHLRGEDPAELRRVEPRFVGFDVGSTSDAVEEGDLQLVQIVGTPMDGHEAQWYASPRRARLYP